MLFLTLLGELKSRVRWVDVALLCCLFGLIISMMDKGQRIPKGVVISLALNSVCCDHYDLGTNACYDWPTAYASTMLLRSLIPDQGFEKRSVLLNEAATAKKLKREFETVAADLNPEDLLILTAVCHGIKFSGFQDGEYLKHNAWEGWALYDRAFFFNELWGILKEIKLKDGQRADKLRIVVISDACYSGGMMTSDASKTFARKKTFFDKEENRCIYESIVSASVVLHRSVPSSVLAILAVPEEAWTPIMPTHTRFSLSMAAAIHELSSIHHDLLLPSYNQVFAAIMKHETRDIRGLLHPPILYHYHGHEPFGFSDQRIFQL